MTSPLILLSLLNLPRIGRKTVFRLVESLTDDLESPDDFMNFLTTASTTIKGISLPDRVHVTAAIEGAHNTLKASQETNIHVLEYSNESFPSKLKNIPDPPPILFVKGDIANITAEVSVTLIGTRKPSEYGRKSAFAIGGQLARLGATVVSGLALGCDTEGHLGCLENNGTTIAVMAHGLDQVTPASNRPLADRIVSNNGCLVSEYPVGVKPNRGNYVDRDRLQSGLGDAVLVVEAGANSGSMHTVEFCEKQGRKLACIEFPENLLAQGSAEGNRVLTSSDRALSIRNKIDVQDFVCSLNSNLVTQEREASDESHAPFVDKQFNLFS
jgi:DNA processing protein